MFGTAYKNNPNKKVLIETFDLEKLSSSIIPHNVYSIIILLDGNITATINNQSCYFEAPTLICLDELKKINFNINSKINAKLIIFKPEFLNINMKIETLRSKAYETLCQQHAFFQLSPFLTTDINKISFVLSEDTVIKIQNSFNFITQNLLEQSDWYWSCRARSYFIDIISIIERMYHNYQLIELHDKCAKVTISYEFMTILEYINNHLNEKITLKEIYIRFRINKNQVEEYFKNHFNTTFHDYIKNRKFEEASYYLRYTELDGEEISQRIGLSSSQNFCKFFNGISGMTPNAFRKKCVEKRKNDVNLIILNNNNKNNKKIKIS